MSYEWPQLKIKWKKAAVIAIYPRTVLCVFVVLNGTNGDKWWTVFHCIEGMIKLLDNVLVCVCFKLTLYKVLSHLITPESKSINSYLEKL